MTDHGDSATVSRPNWYEAMEPWECPRCLGRGHLDSWGDERCEKCKGGGYYVSPEDVARLVNVALDNLVTREFNPLHVRNVILNGWLGPEIDYGRIRHALGRNRRVKHLRTTRDLCGSLAVYGWAAS